MVRVALVEWLRQEDEDALQDEHLYPELSEGLVGYAILEALPPAEVEYLGLKELDCSGGPGGGYAPRVVFKGDPTVLAAALRKWKLPFELHV